MFLLKNRKPVGIPEPSIRPGQREENGLAPEAEKRESPESPIVPLSGKLKSLLVFLYGFLLLLKLKLFNLVLVREFRPLAMYLEREVFPQLRKKGLGTLTIGVQNNVRPKLSGRAGEEYFEFAGTRRIARRFHAMGLREVCFETQLEYGQMIEALLMLIHVWKKVQQVAPSNEKYEGWRSSPVAAAMKGKAGFHKFCAHMRYETETGRYNVTYSYCELLFSRAVRGYIERQSLLQDHRALLTLAPRLALMTLACMLLLTPLIAWGPYVAVALWGVCALVLAGVVGASVHALGTLRYTHEHLETLHSANLKKIKRLSRFPKTNPHIILEANSEGSLVYMNPAVARLLQELRLDEDRALEILPPEFPSIVRTCLEEGCTHLNIETHALGRVFRYDITPFPDDRRVIVAGTDITHLKSVEDELRTLNEDLEKKVDERTRELHHAQKMNALATLAGGIAHDFNNILSAILGHAEFAMLDVGAQSKAFKDIERVVGAANQAKALVQQILLFSRRGEQEKHAVEVGSVVRDALDTLEGMLPGNIEMKQRIDRECGEVMGDTTQIYQIVMNLCTNAFHAMGDSGGVVEVRVEALETDERIERSTRSLCEGPWIRLTVSDTGHGMDEKTMSRIFEPFFTTKPTGEGTGMGLSMIHGIVEDHGGSITVDSVPGEGSTFAVYLPRSAQAAMENAVVPSSSYPEETGERILLVDDEEVIVLITKRILDQLGYRVTALTNAEDALKKFNAKPDRFDLVITDQTMPRITGLQLSERLHSVKPAIPVILVTAYNKAVNKVSLDVSGISKVLYKPVRSQDLAEAVHDALQTRSLQNSISSSRASR